MWRRSFKQLVLTCLVLCLVSFCGGEAALADYEPFLGEMIWVPYNFAPTGWAFCDGRLLLISQNTALFSLLGTTYGGDGRTTFALPDMRGRLMVGDTPWLYNYNLGESGGEETHTLTQAEMSSHNHYAVASSQEGDQTMPAGKVFAQSKSGKNFGSSPAAPSGQVLSPDGMGQAHNNMMPYTTLNCIIAVQGVYPPRP